MIIGPVSFRIEAGHMDKTSYIREDGIRVFEFDGVIHENEKGGAWIVFPWDIRRECGKGRIRVHALFDGIPYDGSVVNMGVKDEDGNICYIIGVLKSIRTKLNRKDGDMIHAVIAYREEP